MTADRDLVLVVGDLNPDLVLRGDVVPRFGQAEQLLDDAELLIGGSAGIAAHGFARLGRPVALVSIVGTDHFAHDLRARLLQAGVDITFVAAHADQPTGLTVVLSRGDDRAILTRPGAIAALQPAHVCAAADALAHRLRHVHVTALFLQPALRRGLAELLADVRRRGVTVSLDTNDDPSGTWAGVDELLGHVDVFLPNRAEAVAIAHCPDVADAARGLAARGPIVVVKCGADGALAASPTGETVATAAPPVRVVDSTGAGDTFDAAFLDAWLGGAPLRHCLARAARAGALATTGLGGTGAQPTAADLDVDFATGDVWPVAPVAPVAGKRVP